MPRLTSIALLAAACGGGGASPSDAPSLADSPRTDSAPLCADAAVPSLADCGGASCNALAITGYPPQATLSTFKGFADPTLAHDPAVSDQLWLAYSWPHVAAGHDMSGTAVTMAAVSTHLARSTNSGATWSYVGEPFASVSSIDPEGSGQTGLFSSETASLATMGGVWYAARLRYFLQPMNGYHPNYATSWTVHVAATTSPTLLASAPDTTLGVSTTAAVYAPAARLDQLAGKPIQDCAILNNPTLFAQNGTLYLIVECLAFSSTTLDLARSSTQVFATNPSGAPATWSWRHTGTLVDATVASELGAAYLQQPDVSLAADGTPIALVTLAQPSSGTVGTRGTGCAALQLAQLDPPKLARDCAGRVVVRAKVVGDGIGACTHDAMSSTGIVPTSQADLNGNWMIRASTIRP